MHFEASLIKAKVTRNSSTIVLYSFVQCSQETSVTDQQKMTVLEYEMCEHNTN
jgi:hypothetical protein